MGKKKNNGEQNDKNRKLPWLKDKSPEKPNHLFSGSIIQTITQGIEYEIRLDNGNVIMGLVCSRMRKNNILIVPNDKVQVSMEKAGDRKGEIIYRLSRASAISEIKHSDMEYEGVVIQAKSSYYLKNNGGYKVLLDRPRFIISCSVSSNMKRNRISIRVGNRVKVLMDSPDFDFFKKGTIFYRFK